MDLASAIAALQANDDATADAAYVLWDLVYPETLEDLTAIRANKVAIRQAGGIPLLVAQLEHGASLSRFNALGVLRQLAWDDEAESKFAILESGAVPLLVAMVESGLLGEKEQAAAALAYLARDSEACCLAIRDAGGIPPLVALVKRGRRKVSRMPGVYCLCANNAADMVAVALEFGVDAIFELARRGRMTVGPTRLGAPGSKRKAALVVAALLRDCVPGFKLAPRDIKMAIGSFF
ncbi:hypothetical protein JL722_4835 [Aureococcus anophagefferens]|nr:hypothetical protein JL722_4835 [Aureococcus anophagefferens]